MDELDNLALGVDWYYFVASSFWVLGLAALLAALSLAHWLARHSKKPFRQILFATSFRPAFFISIALVALGLLLTVESWWFKIGWAGLIAISFWEISVVIRKSNTVEQS